MFEEKIGFLSNNLELKKKLTGMPCLSHPTPLSFEAPEREAKKNQIVLN